MYKKVYISLNINILHSSQKIHETLKQALIETPII